MTEQKSRTRFIFLAAVVAILAMVGMWLYNSTITPLDRPFFLSDREETIEVIYRDWMCNCANFVKTKSLIVQGKDSINQAIDDEYFFVQPTDPKLAYRNADHFPYYPIVRLTGRFYIDKGIPESFPLGHIEDKPDHAKVFLYSKIEIVNNQD